jgi:hypothetical protein
MSDGAEGAHALRRGRPDDGAPGLGAQGTPMGARPRKTVRRRLADRNDVSIHRLAKVKLRRIR